MKYDEMLAKEKKKLSRKKPDNREHRLQVQCVKYFRYQYPRLADLLFAIPNGGRRDQVTGAMLKSEGVISGIADLILLKSNRFYGALAIEMKTPEGRQQPSQKQWQKECEGAGNKYVVCRTFEEFKDVVDRYVADM